MLSIVTNAVGQESGSPPYPVKRITAHPITIDDGLSQGMVNDILQDHFGFMWFATKDGLNMYDGYRFTIYRNAIDDSNSIAENYVTKIYEDSDGDIWIGTFNGRIDRFDRQSAKFKHYRYTNNNSIIPTVTGFHELEKGKITVVNNQTLVIDKKSGTSTPIELAKDAELMTLAKPKEIIYSVGSRIIIKNLETHQTRTTDLSSAIKKYFISDVYLVYNSLTGVKSAKFQQIKYDPINDQIHVVFRGGIATINHKDLYLINVTKSDRVIGFLQEMEKDKIWLNVGGTTYELEISTGRVSIILLTNEAAESVNAVSAFKDRSGLMWIGTRGYGLIKYNPRNESFHYVRTNSVTSLDVLDGKIKVGDVPNYRLFDPTTQSWSKSYKLTDLIKRGYERTGRPPTIDKYGNLWFTCETNLVKYNPKRKDSIFYRLPSLKIAYENVIHCIVIEDSSQAWLGTEMGLIRLNLTDSSVYMYSKEAESNAMGSSPVFSLALDKIHPEETLWVGTNGNGLIRLNKKDNSFKRFAVKDGLPNNVIYGILQHEKSGLWMSTNMGISNFNLEKNTFQNYTVNDGLQSNEFNRYSSAISEEGYFFFGGVKGLNYFKPDEIIKSTLSPQIAITDILIGNKPLREIDSSLNIPQVFDSSIQITLPFERNIFTIQFAALDFTASRENKYRYRMEGFGNDWVYSGTSNLATFTNLDPGTYTFAVTASIRDGEWNNNVAKITIKITPPWYLTIWFKVFAVLTLASLAYLLYRLRLHQALKVVSIKNEIAQDLHDEIGSNLSNISIFTSIAQQTVDESKRKDLLKNIRDQTQSSQSSLQDIVWMITPKKDATSDLISRMTRHASDIFDPIACSWKIHVDESIYNINLNMSDRKNLYLLYKEALNNILKHAHCKNVNIEMNKDQKRLYLRIEDDGVGIDFSKPAGNGLANLKNRALALNGKLDIHSKKGQGTKIELYFTPHQ